MKEELIAFLSRFPSLFPEAIDVLAEQLTVRSFTKGTLLVREGQLCNECYFVLKGCLRQYLLLDGLEKTTAFYTEGQAAVLFSSYTRQTASPHYLSCLEDSLLLIGTPTSETEMYRQFPELEYITRQMLEQDFGKTQDALTRFITSSPEQRYLHILEERPDLLQRAPQHQLASYIGVTPESLSRIRRRIGKAS
ncbi:Crp/Fnr family transcriptional regulator [Tellurirhabdus rosea]|uniref:Crp/Fnr family transcriptional regulator n=1 Tax=Tellurirhabdus rosea TaxID=2674997 RepID=UPI00225AA350|nr:Crp/Fnr family transcriptional regulator [Tellurirhabdus rosea]